MSRKDNVCDANVMYNKEHLKLAVLADWGKGLYVTLQGLGSVHHEPFPRDRLERPIQRPSSKYGCRKEEKVSNRGLHLLKVVKT